MPKRHELLYVGAVLGAIGLLFGAAYYEPKTLERTELSDEESCPYKTYHVSSNSDGGFEFRIERDTKACKEYAATEEAKNGTYRPRNTEEADLLAQKKMAHWTRWIGVFTALGLAVLYATFDATRRAVIETRKIGQAQTGCYPAITKITLRIGSGQNVTHVFSDESPEYIDFTAGLFPELRWTVENYGQTPAYDFAIWPTVKYKIMGEPAQSARASPQRGPSAGDGITLQQKWPLSQSGVVPFALTQDEVNATDSALYPLEVYVLLHLRYVDVFDEVQEPKLAFYGLVHKGNFGEEIDLGTIALETFERGMQSAVAVKYPEER